MTQYLVAIHLPDDFDPASESPEKREAISALNREMIAAGIRVFVGGLHGVDKARTLTAAPNGNVLVTDGPFIEAKEHVGGFWVLELPGMDEALDWGRKAVIACGTPVEVRPFH